MKLNVGTALHLIRTLAVSSIVTSTLAQEVTIPDPGLNAAIRDALQKPSGPLTEQDLLSLTNLNASSRQISSIAGLEAAQELAVLDLDANQLLNLTLPAGMTNLTALFLQKNQLTNCVLPPNLTRLVQLELSENDLTTLTLPAGMTSLSELVLSGNLLTNLTLPPDLGKLTSLFLDGNALTTFVLPPNLTQLVQLDLSENGLTSLTLPPDLGKLTSLFLDGTELTTLVLSEPLAATNLAETVSSLRGQGVTVSTYPLTLQLISPQRTAAGAFEFTLIGPPGVYTVLGSADLTTFSELGVLTNQLGGGRFLDPAPLPSQRFYRARSAP